MSILKDLPQWVIEYNDKNYQSSAGKALRIVMDKAKHSEEEWDALIALAERVKSDGTYGDFLLDCIPEKQKFTILKLLAK